MLYLLRRERNRLRILYDDYPRQFWVLVVGTFIDRVGGALLWPFFTLYITRKFGLGMTQVGLLFGAFSIASIAGSTLGGLIMYNTAPRWLWYAAGLLGVAAASVFALLDRRAIKPAAATG